jgi:hypothetical protein
MNKDETNYEFDNDLYKLKGEIEWYLIKWWGDKCDEFEPECELCKRWKAYEDLIYDPFKD